MGRRREPLEAVAADVTAAGGTAQVATFDGLDEAAVEAHVAEVGRVGRPGATFLVGWVERPAGGLRDRLRASGVVPTAVTDSIADVPALLARD